MIENKISLEITGAEKTALINAIKAVSDLVAPLLVAIDEGEKKSLARISDGRIPFAEKVSQYAVSNPEFVPGYADVAEYQKDFKSFTDIREVLRPLAQIVSNLDNSMALTGSEAYDFARNYYKSVQAAAKLGVPGAQAIYDDLRPLFEIKTSKPEPITP